MSLQQRSLQPRVSHSRNGVVKGPGGNRSFTEWFARHDPRRDSLPECFTAPDSDDSPEPADGAATLEDIARAEQDFLRQRLREELNREPTEEELSEWQREHTEGY